MLVMDVRIDGSPEMEVVMIVEDAIDHREGESRMVAGSLAQLHQLHKSSVIDKMTGESKRMTHI